MIGHLTLFLACFSVFLVGFTARQGCIRVIAYDFVTFVMFSIIEYVIRDFPKHSNLRVFLM
jgi:hypothetical protein